MLSPPWYLSVASSDMTAHRCNYQRRFQSPLSVSMHSLDLQLRHVPYLACIFVMLVELA